MKSSLRHFHLKKKSLCVSHSIPQYKICMIPPAPPSPLAPLILLVATVLSLEESTSSPSGTSPRWQHSKGTAAPSTVSTAKFLPLPQGALVGFQATLQKVAAPRALGSCFCFLFLPHKYYRHLLWLQGLSQGDWGCSWSGRSSVEPRGLGSLSSLVDPKVLRSSRGESTHTVVLEADERSSSCLS